MYAFKTPEGVGFSRKPFGEDSVELTEEEHASLVAGQSADHVIAWSPKGKPYLDSRKWTAEELEVSERAWRNSELSRADIEMNKLVDSGAAEVTMSEWRKYRVALRDWPAMPDFPVANKRPVAPDV